MHYYAAVRFRLARGSHAPAVVKDFVPSQFILHLDVSIYHTPYC